MVQSVELNLYFPLLSIVILNCGVNVSSEEVANCGSAHVISLSNSIVSMHFTDIYNGNTQVKF